MMKYYVTSEEKYLTGVEVHFNSTDGILYYNYNSTASTPYTDPVTKAELINLFNKNLIMVNDGTNVIRPTGLKVSTNYSEVFHTTVGASDKAVKTSYYSKGYTAT